MKNLAVLAKKKKFHVLMCLLKQTLNILCHILELGTLIHSGKGAFRTITVFALLHQPS